MQMLWNDTSNESAYASPSSNKIISWNRPPLNSNIVPEIIAFKLAKKSEALLADQNRPMMEPQLNKCQPDVLWTNRQSSES